MLNFQVKKIFSEKNLFIIFSLANLVPLCLTHYIGSLDGPQHLYSSNIIAQLWKGNDIYHQFYILNPPINGNILGNYLIAFFNLFTHAWLAEKIFLIICLTLFTWGFRYLVISIKGKPDYLTLWIFPFSYHSLFRLGYYNFSLAIAGLFFALGYWIRNKNKLQIKEILIIMLLFTGTYYSHVFVFAFLLLLVGLITIFYFIEDLVSKDNAAFIKFFKRSATAIFAALPGIIMAYFYLTNISGISPSGKQYSEFNHWEYFSRLKMLIGYAHDAESKIIKPLFYFLIISILWIILYRFYRIIKGKLSKSDLLKIALRKNDIWLLISLILLGIYISVPNFMSMNIRVSVLLLYLVILWISLQEFNVFSSTISIGIIFFFGFSLQTLHIKRLKPLNSVIEEIHSFENLMSENDLIITFNYSDDWIQNHFLCNIGTEKPIININSPACSNAFVVNWNYTKSPFTYVGAQNAANFSYMKNSQYNSPVMIAKYVVILGFRHFENLDSENNLKALIKRDYRLVKVSKHSDIGLYEFSAEKQVSKIRYILQNDPAMVKKLRDRAKECNIPFETALLREALKWYDYEHRYYPGG